MKKTWIKRENIYYKPFYKQNSKMLLIGIFLLGIICFVYQAFSINQLPNSSTPFSVESTVQSKRVRNIQQRLKSRARKFNSADVDSFGGDGRSVDTEDEGIKIIRGTRLFDFDAYKPNYDGKFKCLDGSKEIMFALVNDDFCDCVDDGSDEPGTDACANGRFYCKYQKRHITGRGRDVYVPSSRVNDGVCDCCDGSDEWTTSRCKNKCI